jgi:hypothetical protein
LHHQLAENWESSAKNGKFGSYTKQKWIKNGDFTTEKWDLSSQKNGI